MTDASLFYTECIGSDACRISLIKLARTMRADILSATNTLVSRIAGRSPWPSLQVLNLIAFAGKPLRPDAELDSETGIEARCMAP